MTETLNPADDGDIDAHDIAHRRPEQGRSGSWGELFGPEYRAVACLVAGVMLLDGTSTWVTTSLLPTTIEEIGGENLFAWTVTLFLIASVVSSMLVSRILTSYGWRISFLTGSAAFVLGTVVAAITPAMEVLLVGRVLQGLGAGLLAGLSYVLIRSELPPRLWALGTGLISAMMAAGFFIGPVIGGLFSQLGAWRLAFVVIAIGGSLLGVVMLRTLPPGRPSQTASAFPLASILLLVGAITLISTAGVLPSQQSSVWIIAAALLLIGLFVLIERRPGDRARLLPRLAYSSRSTLPWLYLTRFFITAAAATEAFITLFGQRLGGLSPLAAGFLGVSLPVGWAITQAFVSSAKPAMLARLGVAGPLVTVAGLALAAMLQRDNADWLTVAAWTASYLAAGAGIGMVMPYLSTAVMGITSAPEEAAKASSSLNTIGLFAFSFGAAIAGVLLNASETLTVQSAQNTLLGLALLAVLASITAVMERQLRNQKLNSETTELPLVNTL